MSPLALLIPIVGLLGTGIALARSRGGKGSPEVVAAEAAAAEADREAREAEREASNARAKAKRDPAAKAEAAAAEAKASEAKARAKAQKDRAAEVRGEAAKRRSSEGDSADDALRAEIAQALSSGDPAKMLALAARLDALGWDDAANQIRIEAAKYSRPQIPGGGGSGATPQWVQIKDQALRTLETETRPAYLRSMAEQLRQQADSGHYPPEIAAEFRELAKQLDRKASGTAKPAPSKPKPSPAKPAPAKPAPAEPAPAKPAPAQPPQLPAPVSGPTYTVVAGDSEYLIAEKLTGNGSRAPELVKANAQIKKTADGKHFQNIWPGLVLKVPASWVGLKPAAPSAPAPAKPSPASPAPAPAKPAPENPKREAARELTEYLKSIGGLAGRRSEDQTRVHDYQVLEGDLGVDGKYGPGTATRILDYGLIPVVPFYWSSKVGPMPGTGLTAAETQKQLFIANVRKAQQMDPARSAQYDQLIADTRRS